MRVRARAVPVLLALLASLVAGVPGLGGTATAEASVRAAAGTGSISGRVTVPAGVDPTQVTVEVGRADLSGRVGWAPVAADGSYTVSGLPADRYYVEFNGWSAGLLLEYYGDAPSLEQAADVTVGSGPVTGVDVALDMGATVTGMIYTNGRADLTGVRVYLWGAPGLTIPDARVLSDGRWSVRGVPTGSFWVEFDGRGVGLPRTFWNGLGSWDGRSRLPVTAGLTTAGIDITLDGPVDPAVIQAYVTKVYAHLLGRAPDATGLAGWTTALAGGTPYGEVANGITYSDEYRARLIAASYQTYLGRAPDPAGAAGWLTAMRGGLTVQTIEAGFIASDEYYAGAGGTDAGWVAELYRHVLGREAAPSEVTAWTAALAQGGTRQQVAMGFLVSYEHLTDVVDTYYRQLLGRGIDPAGAHGWVVAIQGGVRVEAVIAGIVASYEFRSMR